MAKQDPLQNYKSKRNFAATPEPAEGGVANEAQPVFVVQKHWARRLHYDFRLELDGTMKSWAVPKGPSFDTTDKRMAIHVEDHPLSYNTFEGKIPEGQYGAGTVIVWDQGSWQAVGDPHKGYKNGKLVFHLYGHKLHGRWALIRMKGKSEKQDPWLLIKEKDEYARPASEFSVVDEMPDSVLTGDPAHYRTQTNGSGTPVNTKRRNLKAQKVQRYAALPQALAPQLATLVKSPPPAPDDWLYELKFDGYRLLTRIQAGRSTLYTRNHHDWSDRLPQLVERLDALALPDGWYDGEIVVLDDKGVPDFQQLQNAFDAANTATVDYFLFDMPFCDGLDLSRLPLIERREQLQALLDDRAVSGGALPEARGDLDGGGLDGGGSCDSGGGGGGSDGVQARLHPIRFSEAFDVPARDLLTSACKLGLEGVIAKRKDAPYVSGRSGDWLKLKCTLRQEFVIVGYTAPQGSRTGFGSLLLAVYDRTGTLRYAGNVGTGFTNVSLKSVYQALQDGKTSSSPFAPGTKIPHHQIQWVKPKQVAEVSFAGWTRSGHVRQAVFHGLRTDKPASQITRESAESTESAMARVPSTSPLLERQKVTHPDRVIDPSTKTTKIDLVRYYALVAALMMPHLAGRPVSFLRAPEGVGKKMFFQKHMTAGSMDGVHELSQDLDPEHEPLMEIAQEQGLLSAAQMNVVEFHTWNGIKRAIVRPDRMVFDLDPGKDASWASVQDAALLMRVFLTELDLVPFIKTSGGKGLHVVVPLQRRHDWDAVKDFSHQVVKHLATTFPKRFTAKSGPRNRVGKIFIDYLRNGFGATTVCAWSARARPGMAVSVPLDWREVESLSSPDRWRVANIHERLDVGNDPWQDYADSARTLTAARRVLKALD